MLKVPVIAYQHSQELSEPSILPYVLLVKGEAVWVSMHDKMLLFSLDLFAMPEILTNQHVTTLIGPKSSAKDIALEFSFIGTSKANSLYILEASGSSN